MINRAAVGLFFRSFLIQSFWNREGLQNVGFAFLIIPFLKKIYGGSREKFIDSLKRHLEHFVTNPYMAGLVAVLVAEKEEKYRDGIIKNPAEISGFKRHLSSSIAAIGDSLIWGCLRPLISLVGCAMFFICFGVLTAKVIIFSLALYIILYNTITFSIRYLSGALALKHKMQIIIMLKKFPVGKLHHTMCLAGLAACIFLIVYFIAFNVEGLRMRTACGLFTTGFIILKLLKLSTVKIYFIGLAACMLMSIFNIL